jgi:hypothetical protein
MALSVSEKMERVVLCNTFDEAMGRARDLEEDDDARIVVTKRRKPVWMSWVVCIC